jgi:hypothetical protein
MSWWCWTSLAQNTVKELQGFLGLLNLYRHFLLAVCSTLQPLTDALRGDRKGADPVEWSAEMEAAFIASKKVLSSPTYLAWSGFEPLCGRVGDAHWGWLASALSWFRQLGAAWIFSQETGAGAD